jgi:hypothetical protein
LPIYLLNYSVGAIPFDADRDDDHTDSFLISSSRPIGPYAGFPRGTRTFSIVRCVRVLRVHRLWTTELLETSNLFLRIIRILAALYLTCHLTACLFWAAGSLQAEDNRWTGKRWPITFNVADAPDSTQYLVPSHHFLSFIRFPL